MKQQLVQTIPEEIELTDVKSEQIRILFAAIPHSLIAILVSSLILSVVQWEVIDHATIIAWFVSTNLLSLIRLQMYQQFNSLQKERYLNKVWHRLALLTSVFSGLSWGAGGYFLFSESSLVHQVFLAFVLAGVSAGAITTLAAILNAARVFVILAVAPVIVQLILSDSTLSLEMTTLSLLFTTIILISAKRLNQTIVESLTIRHQHELAEQTIRYQALYDELTDLPNRRQFLARLRQEISNAKRHRRYGAVFFIDLDHFKSINDSLGHAFGDELLVRVAKKLCSRLRIEDTAARLGGDEFVILLPEVSGDEVAAGTHATRIADDLRTLFATPFTIQGQEIHLTISIGIALFPTAAGAEDLLKYADVAMYRAKNDGRDRVRLFSAEMQEAVNHYRTVEKGLREALVNDEFELYFQAQYDSSNRIIGAETLLRWNHPQFAVIESCDFIDIAEQSGLIVPIGNWVLRSACEYLARLTTNPELMLSVNVSPRQFSDSDFVERLKKILSETGANPENLKLEITERVAILNIEHAIDSMNQIKALGVSFSVDDFGTGYSSLNYLNRLPIDELKIDRSFIKDISTSPDNAIIVGTIIAMAQQLKLSVVAEGVETETELAYLKNQDCHFFQGYYLSRPRPFDQFIAELL